MPLNKWMQTCLALQKAQLVWLIHHALSVPMCHMPCTEQRALWYWFWGKHPTYRWSPKQLNCFLIVFFVRPPSKWSICWGRLIKAHFIKGEKGRLLINYLIGASCPQTQPLMSLFTMKMSQGGQTCHISLEGHLLFSHSPKLKAFTSPWLLRFPGSPYSISQHILWICDTKCHSCLALPFHCTLSTDAWLIILQYCLHHINCLLFSRREEQRSSWPTGRKKPEQHLPSLLTDNYRNLLRLSRHCSQVHFFFFLSVIPCAWSI